MNEQRREEEKRPGDEQRSGESMSAKDLFLGLIHSFQAAAMQQMGKVPDPYTQKIERDLPQAKLSIDVLEMLQARTSGNLVGEEARFLQHVLTPCFGSWCPHIRSPMRAMLSPCIRRPPIPPSRR